MKKDAWLAAALEAEHVIVSAKCGPRRGQAALTIAALRKCLGGSSVRAWLISRGLDGDQTRSLASWLHRLAALRATELDPLGLVHEVLAAQSADEQLHTAAAAAAAVAAQQLAAVSSRFTQAWQAWRARLARDDEKALQDEEPSLLRAAFSRAKQSGRAQDTRQSNLYGEQQQQERARQQLATIVGADPRRFWTSVSKSLGTDAGFKVAHLPDRFLIQACESLSGGARRRCRGEHAAVTKGERVAALLQDEVSRVPARRAARAALVRYAGWVE